METRITAFFLPIKCTSNCLLFFSPLTLREGLFRFSVIAWCGLVGLFP